MAKFNVHLTREVTDMLSASVEVEAASSADAITQVQAMIARGHDFNLQFATQIDAGPVEIEDATPETEPAQ